LEETRCDGLTIPASRESRVPGLSTGEAPPRQSKRQILLAQREENHAGRDRKSTGKDHHGSPTSEQVGSPRSRNRRLRDRRETEQKHREAERDERERVLADFLGKHRWRQRGDIDAENMVRRGRRGRPGSCRPSLDHWRDETQRG
jgi:hypothetical protein